MKIKELDTFVDDTISRIPPIESISPHYYEAYAEEDGDGFLDMYYELFITILHNCSDDGKNRFLKVDIGSIPIRHGWIHRTLDIELTNVGIVTTDLIRRKFYSYKYHKKTNKYI
ncbi:DUF3885 domain-containing protein [Caenorhabditis elegans]|nr:DUF3885 domain-containing protein [Caenorhabditis elegans]CTQ86838.1 DUF3885 domain-containing protein [Caenorhabditis elegans]|eukprot:NP_001300139.1 Uncharacterized protein CELE_K04F1.8 [Caenorhabditis elegans]